MNYYTIYQWYIWIIVGIITSVLQYKSTCIIRVVIKNIKFAPFNIFSSDLFQLFKFVRLISEILTNM